MEWIYYLEPFLYPLFLVTLIFSLYSQIKVSSTFRKYSKIYTGRGYNATDVARMILQRYGAPSVYITRVAGNLTDHFNPRDNTLALSDSVYASTSAAAIGVAAHEAGHALQHAEGYFPLRLRRAMVPITSFASKMSMIVILLGVLFTALSFLGEIGYFILLIGVALFSVTTLFSLVTLPCEFNASRRALSALRASGWYTREELSAAKRVLSAAALTYVAAALSSIVSLLRLVILLLGRGDRRR